MNRKQLLEKYSTGAVYTSPAAVDGVSELKTSFWCKAGPKDILDDYIGHISGDPQSHLPRVSDDGVLRTDDKLTEKELDWIWLEYNIRCAILGACTKTVYFTLQGEV